MGTYVTTTISDIDNGFGVTYDLSQIKNVIMYMSSDLNNTQDKFPDASAIVNSKSTFGVTNKHQINK